MDDVILTLIDTIKDVPDKDLILVDKQNIATLLLVIGEKFVQKDIYNDGITLVNRYKDTVFLSDLDSKSYLNQRNQLVLSFIDGCCDIKYRQQTNNCLMFALSILIEMFYYIRNLNLILPHCFLVNLRQSFVSGSKSVSSLNGKISPSTGYTSYKKWVEHQGSNVLVCPDGDIKRYHVASQKIKSADIITATLHIKLGGSDIQKKESLKPGRWMKVNVNEVHKKMKAVISSSNNDFRYIRLNYVVQTMLEMVKFENDDVDKKIRQSRERRRCVNENCKKTYSSLKKKCDDCNEKVVPNTLEERYVTPENWVITKT